MNYSAILRVARQSNNLEALRPFYERELGFKLLVQFKDHDGFDGMIFGHNGSSYHLEFTHHRSHEIGRAPTSDNLLVFYIPDTDQWQAALDQMEAAGFAPVPSFNPYWDRHGRTFEDPDGYRVVLQHSSWTM
jgi:catechol 2,3-dioxygenase-like lactoylglutathione lyase family enzyme